MRANSLRFLCVQARNLSVCSSPASTGGLQSFVVVGVNMKYAFEFQVGRLEHLEISTSEKWVLQCWSFDLSWNRALCLTKPSSIDFMNFLVRAELNFERIKRIELFDSHSSRNDHDRQSIITENFIFFLFFLFQKFQQSTIIKWIFCGRKKKSKLSRHHFIHRVS